MAWQARSKRHAELPPDWPKIRARILTRDGHRCRWPLTFGGTCGNPANEVDHRNNPHDHGDDNLWALCHEHHARKTARESLAARATATRRRPPETHPGRR